jgi:hypothetical protein
MFKGGLIMFIQDDDVVEIKVYCKKYKYRYEAISEKDYNALKTEEEKKKYTLLTVSMAMMNWGLFNKLQDEALVTKEDGEEKFNYKKYKENRIKKLIKSWDAKDKSGKPVPVNENTIAHLSPPVAETILKLYDEASYLNEDEEGK